MHCAQAQQPPDPRPLCCGRASSLWWLQSPSPGAWKIVAERSFMGAEVKGTINSEATHLRKTRNTTIVTGLWLQQALCLCLEQQDNSSGKNHRHTEVFSVCFQVLVLLCPAPVLSLSKLMSLFKHYCYLSASKPVVGSGNSSPRDSAGIQWLRH